VDCEQTLGEGAIGNSRRQFLIGTGALLAVRPARTQQSQKVWRIPAEAEIREFASANRLPDFWAIPPPVGRGGFMSYSPRLSDNARRGAALIDKILKGAK